MRTTFVNLINILILCLLVSNVNASSITLQPNDSEGDIAQLFNSAPDFHPSVGSTLDIINHGTYISKALMKFDLPSELTGKNIESSTLNLFFEYVQNTTIINIIMLTSSWDENTVTWNTQPSESSAIQSSTGPISDGYWIQFDIKEMVELWTSDPTQNFGFSINSLNPNPSQIAMLAPFNYSIPGYTEYSPKLTIEYTGSLVPEPITFILLGAGLLALLKKRK